MQLGRFFIYLQYDVLILTINNIIIYKIGRNLVKRHKTCEDYMFKCLN